MDKPTPKKTNPDTKLPIKTTEIFCGHKTLQEILLELLSKHESEVKP